jgi:hypothetical protein
MLRTSAAAEKLIELQLFEGIKSQIIGMPHEYTLSLWQTLTAKLRLGNSPLRHPV